MNDRERQLEIDRLTAAFLDALDGGDIEAAERIWNDHASDEEVVNAFADASAEMAGQSERHDRRRAEEVVADALRRIAPTLEVVKEPMGPLTIAEVAEHLRRKGAPGLSAAELAVNDALETCQEPLPEPLPMSAVRALGDRFGTAPTAYWKAFREAALELKLRRQSTGEFRLAARPRRPKPKGENQ